MCSTTSSRKPAWRERWKSLVVSRAVSRWLLARPRGLDMASRGLCLRYMPGCVTLRGAMNYDIVATLGPSSNSPDIWQGMLDAGATAFRLNTSHLSLTQLQQWLDHLAPFLSALNPTPPLVLDLQGSKWRLGEFTARVLEPGQHVELVYAPSIRSSEHPARPSRRFLSGGPGVE